MFEVGLVGALFHIRQGPEAFHDTWFGGWLFRRPQPLYLGTQPPTCVSMCDLTRNGQNYLRYGAG